MSQINITPSYSFGIQEVGSIEVPSLSPAACAASPPSRETAAAMKPTRLAALDFAKGTLVLIMVFYHWMNYFVRADGSVYKYLRFLTPSFIFITGFLIARVYLSKKDSSGLHIPGRLLLRGAKLLGIVACLNAVLSTVPVDGLRIRLGEWSPGEIAMAYLTGAAPVAFSVLVPIAYLLILSAPLLIMYRHYRPTFHIACALSLTCALLLDLRGINSNYLQIFSLGTLGISVGHIPMDQLNRFVTHRVAMIPAYLGYLFAITVWDATYPLQIIGVCFSLALIYMLGIQYGQSYIGRIAILLGQYSLFGYIVQIVILQVLRRAIHPIGTGLALTGAALLAGLLSTIFVVAFLDRARARVSTVNKVYTVVFC